MPPQQTSGAERQTYRTLQACRGIAALLVVCFHTGGNLNKEKYLGDAAAPIERLFSFGDSGVAFFFVLSGFIVTFVHRKDFGDPGRLLPYLRKRLTRIYPTYLIVFAAVSAVLLASPSLRNAVPHSVSELVRSILLVPQDPARVGGTGAPVIIVAWSLQYEMIFYSIVALAIIGSVPVTIALVCYLGNFLVTTLNGNATFPQSFFARDVTLLFAMGSGIAFAVRTQLAVTRPGFLASIGGVAFLGLGAIEVLFGKGTGGVSHTVAYGLFSAALVFGLVRLEDEMVRNSGPRVLALLGDASYGLYLIHFPLIAVLCKLAVALGVRGLGGAIASFAVIVPLCVLVAVIFHTQVEKPLLNALHPHRRHSGTGTTGAVQRAKKEVRTGR
jgi:exopolysaccharide production protein ExoZ